MLSAVTSDQSDPCNCCVFATMIGCERRVSQGSVGREAICFESNKTRRLTFCSQVLTLKLQRELRRINGPRVGDDKSLGTATDSVPVQHARTPSAGREADVADRTHRHWCFRGDIQSETEVGRLKKFLVAKERTLHDQWSVTNDHGFRENIDELRNLLPIFR